MPGSGLDAKSTALNTTCAVLVLKGFLSSGRRLSVMNAIRAEIELPGENSRKESDLFRSQEKAARSDFLDLKNKFKDGRGWV